LLLSCGSPAASDRAEEALRERWPIDHLDLMRCPIASWSAAAEGASGTASWLRHYVVREMRQRDPGLLAVLAGPGSGGGEASAARAFVGRLREWGATAPVAVLRVDEDREVEWLLTPLVPLAPAG
jgi:hypothetical protein